MNRLRAAVVGVGYLGRFHAQKYASLSNDVNLVAVCDASAAQSQKVASELGLTSVKDPDELIGKIDIASLATPTSLHFDLAKKFLQAGVHLLVEKPLAATAIQSAELDELAKRKGLVLQVGHIERFNPAFIALKKQNIKPRLIEAFRLAPYKVRALDVDVATDLMIHDIDLILDLVQDDVESIEASAQQIVSSTLDVVHAKLKFRNGCLGYLISNRCYPQTVRTLSVYSSQQHVMANLTTSELQIIERSSTPGTCDQKTITLEKSDALMNEIQSFVAAVKGRGPNMMPAHSAVLALKILEKILATAKQ